MTTPTAAMIFAAGFGTRMGGLTKTTPKPLIRVAKRSLLQRTLDLSFDAMITTNVVNSHYLGDQIVAHLNDQDVIVSPEDHILETGGGLKHALRHLQDGPVFTMNSDAIWTGANPFKVLQANWQSEMGALLLLKHVSDTQGRMPPGDFSLSADGRISRGGDYVFLGAQIIQTTPITDHNETAFSLNVIWDQMIANRTAFGCIFSGEWCDVGRPENIKTAEEMLAIADV
ncbi:MAG: nucleotidyltransferase family protein [Planktomarina sp.]